MLSFLHCTSCAPAAPSAFHRFAMVSFSSLAHSCLARRQLPRWASLLLVAFSALTCPVCPSAGAIVALRRTSSVRKASIPRGCLRLRPGSLFMLSALGLASPYSLCHLRGVRYLSATFCTLLIILPCRGGSPGSFGPCLLLPSRTSLALSLRSLALWLSAPLVALAAPSGVKHGTCA